MHRNIFGYILAHSVRQQLVVLAMTLCSLPFYYVSLDLPKRIINQAIDAPADAFPRAVSVAGRTLASLGQLEFLLSLCGAFLLLVGINGGFKYAINVYKGLLGERMLRRLRYQLYSLILRFPLSQFRKVSQGEMVSIVSSEVEPLGGFIGDAYAQPLYQGGLLLTALGFIFVQDLFMGIAVIALYPLQVAIIPRLQYQVNQLGKQRVREVRKLSNRITESIALAREIRANDTTRYELAAFTGALSRIFDIRYQIYRKKFFIKFLNNFLAQLTPFFFFSIGGVLVIRGDLTIGALVAVLAAYKDLAPPWKELLDYYQAQQDARIRYEQIVAQFDLPDLEPPDLSDDTVDELAFPDEKVSVKNVTYGEDGATLLSDVSFTVAPGEHVAIIGDTESGKDALALILAGLSEPSSGQVNLGDTPLESLSAGLVGRAIAFADQSPAFQTGTLLDNLIYGLKHDPVHAGEATIPREILHEQKEALAAGNSLDNPDADWIDYPAAGAASPEQLVPRAVAALEVAGLDGSLFEFGLRAQIASDEHPEIVAKILALRAGLSARLQSEPLVSLVERFDPDQFNTRISIAENLLFGEPVGDAIDLRRMADNRYVRSILKRTKIDSALIGFGHEIAKAGIALVDGGMSKSKIAEQYLPVQEDEISQLTVILGLAARKGPNSLPKGHKRLLESLAMRMNPSRHRHLTVPLQLQSQILTARREFRQRLTPTMAASIAFFDPGQYNSALTVRENIIFGAIEKSNLDAARQINEAISEIAESNGLRSDIEELGLAFHIGTGGAVLTPAQKQRLAIARAVIKRPQLFVICDAMTDLDAANVTNITRRLRQAMAGRTIIYHTSDDRFAENFDRIIQLQSGRIVADRTNA